MLTGKGQTQHWMETATNWENPKRDSRINTGRPACLLYGQGFTIAK